ncbi:MAG: diaminopimelate epimerase [Firmicutes bacterium]|nr:diaminopimelate epimerase [Alicyclobacillaceae bacterium]MCL6496443.1 diaminopimelate epimerase [Bacillota bacterium]
MEGPVRFTKMHGCGNDYLFIDVRHWPAWEKEDWPRLAQAMSDRHFGVGADGIILIAPSRVAPVRMRIFNSDGSESEMCGNGLRSLAKWLYDRGELGAEQAIETGAGVLHPQVLEVHEGRACWIRVDMGEPAYTRAALGMEGDPDASTLDLEVSAGGITWRGSAVSMGNPHLVLFGPRWSEDEAAQYGPLLEHHPWFPHRINVHSVEVVSPEAMRIRHWERGAGLTLACGTGVCAATVAGVLTGRTARAVTVDVPGGTLRCQWDAETGHVWLEGPAVEVCEGQYWPR